MTPDRAPDALSPAEVDALLAPDPRAHAADLLVLRDALLRMAGALARLSDAVEGLEPPAPGIPPRAD